MNLIGHNVEVKKEVGGRLVLVSVSGKLTRFDYEMFVPEIEMEIARFGKVRTLFDLVGFHGWTMGALFEDTKFAVKHYGEIDRIAFVGDKRWEQGIAVFCKPFTRAKIRYFDIADFELAREWLSEGLAGLG